jgi:hypothetical protein
VGVYVQRYKRAAGRSQRRVCGGFGAALKAGFAAFQFGGNTFPGIGQENPPLFQANGKFHGYSIPRALAFGERNSALRRSALATGKRTMSQVKI